MDAYDMEQADKTQHLRFLWRYLMLHGDEIVKETADWGRQGFELHVALEWAGRDFEPAEAREWVELGFYPFCDPCSEAKAWNEDGVGPRKAATLREILRQKGIEA